MSRRAATKPSPAPATAPASPKLILLAEATRCCGWRRTNTFRERFLATEADADAMGLAYDEHGRAMVEAAAVVAAAQQVAREKAARAPNWRARNLGAYARPRPKERPAGAS